jgi:hypothetical protein
MTTTTNTTAGVASTAALPPLPVDSRSGDGYDWISDLTGGWRALACWARDGWDLGEWPYAIVAVCTVRTPDGTRVYGVATYTEGDTTVDAYATPAERDHDLDTHAAWHWRHTGNGPTVPEVGPLREEHTGPYRTTHTPEPSTPEPAPADRACDGCTAGPGERCTWGCLSNTHDQH